MNKYELGESLISRTLAVRDELAKWRSDNHRVMDYRVEDALRSLNVAARDLLSLSEEGNKADDEDKSACSPACFDDCDGDDDSHVPAGTYDPSLPY